MKNTKRVLAFLVGAAMMMPMVSAESANEYEATAQGFGGPVTVKITVDGGKVKRKRPPLAARPSRR